VLANVRTKDGIVGEIQFNTDRMIFAKEKPEDAKKIIGEKRWNEIHKETGLEGGLGHKFYEEYRSTSKITKEGRKRRNELIDLSTKYYNKFR